jgi:hypothetical protein
MTEGIIDLLFSRSRPNQGCKKWHIKRERQEFFVD